MTPGEPHGVQTLYRRPELAPGRIYATERLLPWLRDLGLLTEDIRPYEPPHLGGRAPFVGGWARGLPDTPAGNTSGRCQVSGVGVAQLSTLSFLNRFGHATPQQMAAARGRARTNIHAVLRRLERQGLAQRHRGQRRGSRQGQFQEDVWSATPAGLAVIASSRWAVTATPSHRRHTLALVDLARQMEADTNGTWETERELAGEVGAFARDHVPSPDGRLTLPDGRRILLQLQLSEGKPNRQCRYAWRQRLAGVGDEIWFVCTPEVAPPYRRQIKPTEADFIKVVEWTPPDRSGGRPDPIDRSPRRSRQAAR